MKIYSKVALMGFILFCMTVADAQISSDNFLSSASDKASTTNYYFARSNDITIIVNIIGFVQRPGRYEIASSIDLVNLIALAGGPTTDGSLSNVRIIRIVKDGEKTLRRDVQPEQNILSTFLKEEVKKTRKSIRVNLDNLSTVQPEDLQLMSGDLIFIDRTDWSVVRDVFGVVVSTAILTTAITQIISTTKK